MPPKVQKLVFDERGRVILPAGALAPSEETLLARAHLLQGQEARRDSDELLSSSIATPEELKAFVGGRTLTPADILGAKVAQASAAQLREGVAQAALLQVAATNAGARDVRLATKMADAAARVAAAQAAIDAAAGHATAPQMAALVQQKAELEQKLKAALAAQAAPAPTAPAPTAPATPTAPAVAVAPVPAPKVSTGVPDYARKVRGTFKKLIKDRGAHPDAAEGIDALDELTAGGFWSVLRSPSKRGTISARERGLLKKVQKVTEAERITVKSGSALRNILDQMHADDMAAGMPSAPATPISLPAAVTTPTASRAASPLPSVPTTPPTPATPPGTPVPAPQTGSGLGASDAVPAWKLGAARAMDLAETGDQVGALRLLTKYATTMPEDKMAQVYRFVLAQHVKYTQRDGQL